MRSRTLRVGLHQDLGLGNLGLEQPLRIAPFTLALEIVFPNQEECNHELELPKYGRKVMPH